VDQRDETVQHGRPETLLAREFADDPDLRIDLGFALGDIKGTGRLVANKNWKKGDRLTHLIAIGAVDEIDDEVKRWLKAAYDLEAEK